MLRTLAYGLLLVAPAVLTPSPLAADSTWPSDPAAALAEARDQDTYVFVDLYAEWCGWCKVLEEEVFTTPAFAEVTRGMVLLRVDVEDGAAGSALQAEYEVGSLPTALILDGHGAVVGQVAGYAPADEYLHRLQQQLDSWKDIQKLVRMAAQDWDDLEQLRMLGDQLYERKDGAGAAAIYERLLSFLPQSGPASAWIRYRAADSRRRAGDWESAKRHLELTAASQSRQLAEKVALLRFTIARDQGHCDEAKESLQAFLKDYPASDRAVQVEKTLTVLQSGDGEICA